MRTLTEADFVTAMPPAELGDDEIHLWIFPQCGDTANVRVDTERRLRDTLAAYLAVHPTDLPIERSPTGKPYLADSALQFNLSHSGRTLLIGLSRSQSLGVDIESGARQRPYLEIARRYFSHDEAAVLTGLPDDRVRGSFLGLWSAKEAVLKAIGRGIAFGLDRVGFALDTDGTVRELAHVADEAWPLANWNIVRLAPAPGLIGAVAWHGRTLSIRAFVSADFSDTATVCPATAS